MAVLADAAGAEDFELRALGGSVQLGGELVIGVRDGEKSIPDGATCTVILPEPYDAHLSALSSDCAALTLRQGNEPIRDDAGYALPAAQVPYTLVVRDAEGDEVGRVTGVYPYHNQFTDLRILIKDIRNPVSPGQSFDVAVLGAGKPIADSLVCRWNTYGPVVFEPTRENGCEGRITAGQPDGRDGDMDVGIFNLTDMHAVGYATAKILVE